MDEKKRRAAVAQAERRAWPAEEARRRHHALDPAVPARLDRDYQRARDEVAALSGTPRASLPDPGRGTNRNRNGGRRIPGAGGCQALVAVSASRPHPPRSGCSREAA